MYEMYVNKLNSPQVQQDLSDTLTKNLQQLTQDISDPDAAWAAFRDTVNSTAEAVTGHPQRKYQNWFDDNNQEILDRLERKRAAHAAWLGDNNCVQTRTVQEAEK